MADWVTVAAYLLAAMLSARAAMHASLKPERRESIFWRITAVLLVLLGINELLDLQMLLTIVGREHAKANGWYDLREKVQFLFVAGLSVAMAITGTAMILLTRRAHVSVRLALVGLVSIGMFILLRAASFHHLDRILGGGALSFNSGAVQEMAGILIVAGAAVLYVGKSASGDEARNAP